MTNSKLIKLISALILLVVFLLSAVFLFIGIGKDAGINPPDARNGVVLVQAYATDTQGNVLADKDGNIYGGEGTGWMIGTPGQPAQYIVTNGHVVQWAYELVKKDPNNYGGVVNVIFSAAENNFVIAQIVYYSPENDKDIAILKLPEATNKRTALALRDSDNVSVGEEVYALGYPGASSDVQSYKTFDQGDITVTKGIVSKRTNVTGTGYESFQMDTYINHGNSGGPLVDKNGFVVGINTLGLTDTNMNFAIVSNELIHILRSEGIPFTEKGQSDWMLYAFAPIAVLALIGALLLLLSIRKVRKVNNASGNPAAAAAGKAIGYGKAVLRCVGGQHAGEVFSFGPIPLTLGRDAKRCNIVFNSNTPGVSACHCTVQFNAAVNIFTLTDNGSSYGTFLDTGKKLAPNVPYTLALGQTFYLADGKQRFTVSME